jgi:leader peptidase (prepilin peptidase) / N-methyltransferase
LDIFLFNTALLFGAVVGSFLNVVILRLPDPEQSIVFPASHCPKCNSAIHWYDNLPILSYLLLRGRCRSCREPISIQYPLIEACMALLSGALFIRFDLGIDFLYYFFFCASLLVIIFIDCRHQIIPDLISLPGMILGFAGSFVVQELTWIDSGIGLLAGGGILFAVALIYFLLTKRDGMGGGDIKLLAMIGAFLGWQSLLFVIFASSLLGSLAGIVAMIQQRRGGQTKIPYGPFLSLAALAYLFFQVQILDFWRLYLHSGGFSLPG